MFIEAKGFDTVVGVVPVNASTLRPDFTSSPCYDDPEISAGEDPVVKVAARPYAIQIGGWANYAGDPAGVPDSGLLEFEVEFYSDRDGDDVLDAPFPNPDECPSQVGPSRFQGCPDSDGDDIPDTRDDCDGQRGLPQHGGCPDTDADNIPDVRDECDRQPGSASIGGCPDGDGDRVRDANDAGGLIDRCLGQNASARDANGDGCLDPVPARNLAQLVTPGLNWDEDDGKLVVKYIQVQNVPAGARIVVACQRKVGRGRYRRCRGQVVRSARVPASAAGRSGPTARAAKTLRLRKLRGQRLSVGSRVVVRVTAANAIGKYTRWTVVRKGGQLDTRRFDGCMDIGQKKRYKRRGCR